MNPGQLVGSRTRDLATDRAGMPRHYGIVLRQDDVRLWTGTLRFYGEPEQAEVTAHVERCHAQGLLGPDTIGVLWLTFGRCWWETEADLYVLESPPPSHPLEPELLEGLS